jgi:hypothetical protein
MARDFTDAVIGSLGSATSSPDQAWGDLERRLSVQLSDDCKEITSSYAPVQLNGHLFLAHPSTGR